VVGAVSAGHESALSTDRMLVDLNCDLGEGEPMNRTRALMRWITSANVACGGHAGDVPTMAACVSLARQHGVRLGAHPGLWNRGDFGRCRERLAADDLELLLLHQVGALDRVARWHRVPLHHIKLHGALYHASEQHEALAVRYACLVKRFWPRVRIYARAGGRVARVARRTGLVVWEEAFADRGYCDDGTLVPRNAPNALLVESDAVVARVRRLVEAGEIISESGKRIALRPRTLCLHSDTQGAARLARAVAKELERVGGFRSHVALMKGRA